jgi:hypothetical protein
MTDYERNEPKRNAEFEIHLLNDAGLANASDIRDGFDDLLNRLQLIIPIHGREYSIMKTKLEEACFFAKKALAVIEKNQR